MLSAPVSVALALTPCHPFSVAVWSGDGERFAKLFAQAWTRLPGPVQAGILQHWTNGSGPPVHLELSNLWKNHGHRWAEVTSGGYEINFNAAGFDRMPEQVAECHIAHELGHVRQYACGTITGTDDDELEIIRMLNEWGFDWIGAMRWM